MATSRSFGCESRGIARLDPASSDIEPHADQNLAPVRHEWLRDLQRSNEFLRATLAEAAETLVMLDTGLAIRFLSKSYRGLDPGRWVGQGFAAMLPVSARERVSIALQHLIHDGKPTSFEYADVADPERRHFFEGRAVCVDTQACGTMICVAIRDVGDRKHLERELLEVTDAERQRIGRDLHDGIGQELTGISLMLKGLASQLDAPQRRALDEIGGLVTQSLNSVRALSSGLLPVSGSGGGLIAALGRLIESSRQHFGLAVDFHADAWPELELDDTEASHLYRIAQEALTNVARHSGATGAQLALTVAARSYCLEVADDGRGIGAPRPRTGLGLRIMAYRADIIGATLAIDNKTPRGTLISVTGKHAGPPSGV